MSESGFDFTIRAVDATKKGLYTALSGVESFARRASHLLTSPFRALTSLGTMAFVANVNTLTGALQKVADVIAQQEDGMSRLKTTLSASGYAAGLTAKQIGGMAGQISRVTAFEDDAIVEAQAVLARAGNMRGQMFKEASKLVVDMAAAMGSNDLPTVAKMLSMAMADPARGMAMLRRAGVALTLTERAMIKSLIDSGNTAKAQATIFDLLRSRFSGMAEEMANTTTGSVRRMQVSLGEMVESGANAVSPLVKVMADKIEGYARAIADKIEPIGTAMEANLGLVGTTAKDVGKSLLQSLGISWDEVGGKAATACEKMIAGLKSVNSASETAAKIGVIGQGFWNAGKTFVHTARGAGAGVLGTGLKAAGGGYFGAENWATWMGQGLLETAEKAQKAAEAAHNATGDPVARFDEISKRFKANLDKIEATAKQAADNTAKLKAKKAHQEAIEQFRAALGPISAIGSRMSEAIGKAWEKIGGTAKDAAKAAEEKWKAAGDRVKTALDRARDAALRLKDAQREKNLGWNEIESQKYEIRMARAGSETERRKIMLEQSQALMAKSKKATDTEERKAYLSQGLGIAMGLAKESAVFRDNRARTMTDNLVTEYQSAIGLEHGATYGSAWLKKADADQELKDAEREKRRLEGAQKLQAAKEALAPMKDAAIETAKAVFELRDSLRSAAKAGMGVLFGVGRGNNNGQVESGAAGSLSHVAG
ncbi:MAG TPA: hypothetical protein PKY77_05790 [Phycisphaerae bacterium]|nr:hypothetical protein [Phycisphaerae bacterium]HRY69044.1 hypothetical protein [Phycisphaerae bacterium]HSA25981.1 hypothetical protein [Phycisphaerae bacterium]